jgi:bifunctional non-homologous end joining protein LigD
MSERSIYLYCTEGGSDKEYHVHLRSKDGGWVVDYANGKRGAVGQSKPKTPSPVPLAAASKVFDDLVKSKKKGGYTEGVDGVRFTNTDNDRAISGHRQQLPTPIDEEGMLRALSDENMAMQEKANGERRTIEIVDGKVRGINKLGQYVNLPESLVQSLSGLRDLLIDGEQVGSHFYAFDLLRIDQNDMKPWGFWSRIGMLESMIASDAEARPESDLPKHLTVLQAYRTTEAKTAFFEQLKAERREGAVLKRVDQPYEAGRSNSVFKFKFVESVSCVVLAKTDKRSVLIGLANSSGEFISTGRVTIPANHEIPEIEDVVEVQYLYFNPGGAFEQPVYLGKRNDVRHEEATFAQITRIKPGAVLTEQTGVQFDSSMYEDAPRERQRG